MSQKQITFIGGGNMATSLIGGLINNGHPASAIRATDPLEGRRNELSAQFGIDCTDDNALAAKDADVVVLAVKPQVMASVATGLSEALAARQPLVLSIAAGIRGSDIERWLGYDAALVRAMPNTPALVGSGITGMFANANTSAAQRDAADSVMRAVGATVWVESDELIDAVTAVSGSGPAYFFLLMEHLSATGVELGLSAEASRELALHTALGAARIALEGDDAPDVLRQKVTSPGGTTERALNIFYEGGMPELVRAAATGARDRAVELADELGKS